MRLVYTSVLLVAAAAFGEPLLPAMFSDHAVLQRGRPIPVWGWAGPGENIEVRFGAAAARTVAAVDGRWRVELPAHEAGGPYTLTVAGETTLRVRDVLVGEVWVASGQSNMAFDLARASTAAADIPKAADDEIRLFTVPKATSLKPLERFRAGWEPCTPESAKTFSAVAYYFGREIHEKLGVPVGLIHTSWPGTQAEEWTDPESMRSDPDFAPILKRWAAVAGGTFGLEEKPLDFELFFEGLELAGAKTSALKGKWTWSWESAPDTVFEAGPPFRVAGKLRAGDSAQLAVSFGAPADLRAYSGLRFRTRGRGQFKIHFLQPSISDWDNYTTGVIEAVPDGRDVNVNFADLKQAGWGVKHAFTPESVTDIVFEPLLTGSGERPPSGLYNAMIAPLIPYGIRGAIWYQGEGNSGRSYQYRKLLPAMIRGWRAAWDQGDFPFLIVQLPNYRARKAQPSGSGWAELREAQLMTLRMPNTGLAVTIDLGEAADVHPHNKRPVGERLARWALGTTYGKAGVYSGPLYDGIAVEGSRIRVRFRRTGQGIAALGGGPLRGFAIAGEDRKFEWAEAEIVGDTVVVRSAKVARPIAVRYAWADNPDCNLGNRDGLPASPFRSDDWPGITAGER